MFNWGGDPVARRDIRQHELVHFGVPAVAVGLHGSQTWYAGAQPRVSDGRLASVSELDPMLAAIIVSEDALFLFSSADAATTPEMWYVLPPHFVAALAEIAAILGRAENTKFVTTDFLIWLHDFLKFHQYYAAFPGAPLLPVEAAYFPDLIMRLKLVEAGNVACFYSSQGMRVIANRDIRKGEMLTINLHDRALPQRNLKRSTLAADPDYRLPFLCPGHSWTDVRTVSTVLASIQSTMREMRSSRAHFLHALYLLSRLAHALPRLELTDAQRTSIAEIALQLGADRLIPHQSATDLLTAYVLARMVVSGIPFGDRAYLTHIYETYDALVPELMSDISKHWVDHIEDYFVMGTTTVSCAGKENVVLKGR